MGMGHSRMSTTEQEIERLVDEISRAIQRSPADQRHELRSYASSLISDIATQSPVQPSQTGAPAERRPFGLVAAGLALLVIGAGFALMIPPIGLTLVALGVVLAIWGGIAGWWTTRGDDVHAGGPGRR
jgi:Flp pilus assembly protein TadB